MSKHTPGPWIYDIHEHAFYIFTKDGEMVADGDPDDVGIARMRGTGRGADAAEQEANAALIAAAPTQHEALRIISEGVNSVIDNWEYWDDTQIRDHILGLQQIAQAAYDRGEGRSS